jgi:hypothetical protein
MANLELKQAQLKAKLTDKTKPDTSFRKDNMAKAREVRMRKIHEKKIILLNAKVSSEIELVDEKIEDAITKKVEDALSKMTPAQLKGDIYRVFYDMGGTTKLLEWVLSNKKNKAEFYKMIISLLKTDTERNDIGHQGVVVNFIAPPNTSGITMKAKESKDNKMELTFDGSN